MITFKYIMLILVLTIQANLLSAGNKIKKNKKIIESKSYKKNIGYKIVLDPKCRMCCSESVMLEDGTVISATACAGSFFTSCQTAVDRACDKTHGIIEDYINSN